MASAIPYNLGLIDIADPSLRAKSKKVVNNDGNAAAAAAAAAGSKGRRRPPYLFA